MWVELFQDVGDFLDDLLTVQTSFFRLELLQKILSRDRFEGQVPSNRLLCYALLQQVLGRRVGAGISQFALLWRNVVGGGGSLSLPEQALRRAER